MANTENRAKVEEIFSQCMDLPRDKVNAELSTDSTSNWDSMATVNLIAELEGVFAIQIEPEEFASFTSFTNVVEVLRKKGIDW